MTTLRLGDAPRHNAANLVRGLSLCAAVAAGLFGPTVLAGRGALELRLVIVVVTLLTIGAGLLALLGRVAAPRSVRAWVLWVLGTLVLGAIAALSLGGAMIALLAEEGAAVAYAAAAAWALAGVLNVIEASRAYAVARTLWWLRLALYRVAAVLVVGLAALRVASLALPPLQRALVATPLESLAPGSAAALGLAFALATGVAAWHLPRALAQRQFDGRVSASAASESMWFAGLATLIMPWAMADAPLFDATASVWLGAWAEIALHVLTVIVAHGAVRIVFGGAGSIPPVPLLVLLRSAAPEASARRLLARLPAAWGAGPVCRVMPPPAAAREHGAHLQLAALAGTEGLLFPLAAHDLAAWRDALPPPQQWRALATRELYAEPSRWRETLGAQLTPQTWVLLVEDGASRPPPRHGEDWADELPEARTVRLNLGRADPGYWPAALAHWPGWTDATGSGDAKAFAAWLRERVRPEAPRRILLLHAKADAALAALLAAQLDGCTDAQGRFVEAWTVAEHGALDWRMPLGGFRLMAQVQYRHVQQRLGAGAALGWAERANLQAMAGAARIWLGLRPDAAAPPYDLVLLHTEALRAAAQRWKASPDAMPLLAAATRRLGLRLDRSDASLCTLDAQIAAPLADPSALGAAALRVQANRLAEQILADAWVGLAVEGVAAAAPAAEQEAPPPAAPPVLQPLGLPWLDGLEADVSAIASWPDGTLIAGMVDGRITMRREGRDPAEFVIRHRGAVTALLALSSARFASASDDGEVRVHEAGDAELRELGRHSAAVLALASAGRLVLAGDADGDVTAWPVEGGEPVARWHGFSLRRILALGADTERVYAACGDGGVRSATLGSDVPSEPLRSHTETALALACRGDNLYVGGSDPDGRGFLRRARLRRDGLDERALTGLPVVAVTALLVLPDERVVFATDQGGAFVWNPEIGFEPVAELPSPIRMLALLPGDRLATLSADGKVRAWALPMPPQKAAEAR